MSSILKEYRQTSNLTAVYPRYPHLDGMTSGVLYPIVGLAGEAGELLNKYKKVIRDDGGTMTGSRMDDLADELGDVFWYWFRVCLELGYDPEYVIRRNVAKLEDRLEREELHGEGDER